MMSTVEEILNAVRELPPQEQVELRRRLSLLMAQRNKRVHNYESYAANDSDQRIQRALYDAGLLSEIKLRPKRPRPRRPPIKIKGKPLSETIIEDRR
jgi:hypothetical protein